MLFANTFGVAAAAAAAAVGAYGGANIDADAAGSTTSNGFVQFDLHRNARPGGSQAAVSLVKSDKSVVAATLDNEEVFYQIQLGIGSPAQLVDFTIDTGSSDLWVMAASNPFCATNPGNVSGLNCTGSIFDPERSRTFRPLHEPFQIGYGDSTAAEGELARDTITIGGRKLHNATFAVANVSNASTCVFGVGFIGDESQAVVHKNGTGVYPTYFNVPTMMKQQHLIHTNAYSLWLNNNAAEHGSILFGGVDASKYEGDLHVMPVFNGYRNYIDQPVQMRVMLNGINANGHPLVDFDIAVLLDSGTSFAYLPREVVEPLGNALGFTYEDTVGFYHGGLETALNNVNAVSLNFSGAPIEIDIENLLVALTLDDGTPLILDGEAQVILAVGVVDDSYMYILGDVFLRGIYAVFDLDHYQIAVAKAKVNNVTITESEIRTIDASIPGAVAVPNYASTSTNTHFTSFPYYHDLNRATANSTVRATAVPETTTTTSTSTALSPRSVLTMAAAGQGNVY